MLNHIKLRMLYMGLFTLTSFSLILDSLKKRQFLLYKLCFCIEYLKSKVIKKGLSFFQIINQNVFYIMCWD